MKKALCYLGMAVISFVGVILLFDGYYFTGSMLLIADFILMTKNPRVSKKAKIERER